MQYFFDKIIKPCIIENQYSNICEIGSSDGGNVDKLLTFDPASILIIDPCMDVDLVSKYKDIKRVKVFKGLSLDVLPDLSEKFDCILIDGDHNWYTVFSELMFIEGRDLLKENGTIFLHDVSWPYGRRDMYYVPGSIPQPFCHPYAQKGIERGVSELTRNAIVNSHLHNAIYEGGPRNGVLTAIEDFLKEMRGRYMFLVINEEHGLGILTKRDNIKPGIREIKLFLKVLSLNMKDFPLLVLKNTFYGLKNICSISLVRK